MSAPIKWSPWFAYDCMVTAYQEKRWWAAATIARKLLEKLETPGSEAARWFPRRRWCFVADIAREAQARLAENESQPAKEEAAPRPDQG